MWIFLPNFSPSFDILLTGGSWHDARYWRDTSLAAQVLIGCLMPSVQQQQANTAPFHTEQT